jgi:hypothetical protein
MSRQLRGNCANKVLAFALALSAGAAYAADSYDGTWRGASTMRWGVGCSITTSTSFVVRGSQVEGEEAIPPASFLPTGKFPIRGTIFADGGFKGGIGDWPLGGKFIGDSFEGDYEFGQCTMIMRLQRVR